jgi:alpha-beta hydrolase superfamily lysophospholipase
MTTAEKTPVVFIHGLWMHTSSWDRWVELFNANGYDAINPGWPGDGSSVADQRANAARVSGYGVQEVFDHYAQIIRSLPSKPIVVGHSFGGLIAQKLLGEGLAVAAVAIDPAQFRGVLPLPFAQLKSAFPVLGNPGNRKTSNQPTKKQFHANFAGAITQQESDALYDRFVIPSPGRPLFQAATANFDKKTPASVKVDAKRGPLLLTAGGKDNTVPEVTVQAAYKQYASNSSVTELKVFPDRAHSLAIDKGWREVADASLAFLARNGL